MEPDVKQALKALQYPSDAKLARVTGQKAPLYIAIGRKPPEDKAYPLGVTMDKDRNASPIVIPRSEFRRSLL